MNHLDHANRDDRDNRDDVIAAFADGEPVGAPELDAALADPAGRAYLIDLLALRGLAGDASAWRLRDRAATLPRSASRSSGRRWMPAVAALLVVGVAGGYAIGRRAPEPSVDRAGDVESVAPALMLSAPAPTRVIQLEPGRDWTETGGR